MSDFTLFLYYCRRSQAQRIYQMLLFTLTTSGALPTLTWPGLVCGDTRASRLVYVIVGWFLCWLVHRFFSMWTVPFPP